MLKPSQDTYGGTDEMGRVLAKSVSSGKLSSLTTHLQHDEVLDRAAKERKRRKRNGDRPQSVSKRGVDPD